MRILRLRSEECFQPLIAGWSQLMANRILAKGHFSAGLV